MSQTPRIADTLPELQGAYLQLAQLAAAAGICASMTLADYGAYRTSADTADILGFRDADYAVYVRALKAKNPAAVPTPKEKWRPIAGYGHSYHDFGAAFDVTLHGVRKGLAYADAMRQVGAIAPKVGLRWGGAFGDPAHFELAVPIGTAAAKWSAYQATRRAAPTSIVADATEAAGDAADHAAAQASIAAEEITTKGVSPVTAALFAALTLGALGVLVARRFSLFT